MSCSASSSSSKWRRTPRSSSPLSPTATLSASPSSSMKRKKTKEPFSVFLLKRMCFRSVEVPGLQQESKEAASFMEYTQHGRIQPDEYYMYRRTRLARNAPEYPSRLYPIGKHLPRSYMQSMATLYGECLYLRIYYPAMFEVLYGPLTEVCYAGSFEDGQTVVYGLVEANACLSTLPEGVVLKLASFIDASMCLPGAGFTHQHTLAAEVARFHSVPIHHLTGGLDFDTGVDLVEQAAEVEKFLAEYMKTDDFEQTSQPMITSIGTAEEDETVQKVVLLLQQADNEARQEMLLFLQQAPENLGENEVPETPQSLLPPTITVAKDEEDPLQDVLQDLDTQPTPLNSEPQVPVTGNEYEMVFGYTPAAEDVLQFDVLASQTDFSLDNHAVQTEEETRVVLDTLFPDSFSEYSYHSFVSPLPSVTESGSLQDALQVPAVQLIQDEAAPQVSEARPAKRRSPCEDEPQTAKWTRFNPD